MDYGLEPEASESTPVDLFELSETAAVSGDHDKQAGPSEQD